MEPAVPTDHQLTASMILGVDSPDWSSLADQLLVHIFEQQHNALDNCAAACTCTTWRLAVNSSHISSLHLHADQAPYGSHWRHFFASRRSFGHLRLTAGNKSVGGEVANNFGEPSSCSDSLQGIPLACDCLSVDTTFAGMLRQYIQQPAKLKQLAMTWDCNWVNRTNFEIFAFPNLTHLSELTTLQIRAENGSGSLSAELIQYNLNRCPETLEHVTLDCLGLWHRDGQRSTIQQVLGSPAASLTCLEMRQCEFSLGGSSISCLAHLKSLSFQGSLVWDDASDITMLTNLTLLDLSESLWYCPKLYNRTVPVMLVFTGWSALQVLKLSNCCLFDRQTVLHLPGVVDLQLHWAPVNIGSSTLRICSQLASHQWMADLLPHANLLVELDISEDQLGWCKDSAFAERLGRLLSLCHRLQSFTFYGPSSARLLDGEKLVVDRHSGACLQRLSLSQVFFRLLDLHDAVHVTSLELHNVDAIPGFTLLLPHRVQSFDFTGSYLFTPEARHVLLACTCLHKLTLVGNIVVPLGQFNMPLLPSSLCHLDIQSSRADLSESEWDWPNSGRAPDMLLFTGWSALQVLKLSDCSLFNQQTALHLPCVVDLQLGWVPVCTGSSTLRIWTPCADEQCVFELLPHANLLVELDLSVNQLGSYLARTASQKLAERLGQLLSLCHRLQSFKFIGFSSGGPLEAEEMVIDRHNGACLHRLSLPNVRFRLLDLQNAVSLTSLALRNVDAAPDFTLVLPPWLQSFDFTGRFLFTPQARHVLLECTSLNKLRVVGKGVITLAQCNMPLLPISLRHLDIQTSRADRGWIDCCDWKCLNACTNIEFLRLPSPEHLVGYLKAWVHGARHLHIVEFRTTFIV